MDIRLDDEISSKRWIWTDFYRWHYKWDNFMGIVSLSLHMRLDPSQNFVVAATLIICEWRLKLYCQKDKWEKIQHKICHLFILCISFITKKSYFFRIDCVSFFVQQGERRICATRVQMQILSNILKMMISKYWNPAGRRNKNMGPMWPTILAAYWDSTKSSYQSQLIKSQWSASKIYSQK